MPTAFSRDLSLDLTLESEARTTLIFVGVSIAVLLLVTATFFLWPPTLRLLRRALFSADQSLNQVEDEEKSKLPLEEATNMPISNTVSHLRQEQQAINSSKMASLFGPASIRKYPSAPHRSKASLYRGANGLHVSPFGTPGSPAAIAQTMTPARGVITPHIAEWMAVADSVVGQHPDAQPLNTRIATQAEIDMISGHVHIPWAYKKDPTKPPPIAVKARKPVGFHPAVPGRTPLLKDVGNIHSRDTPANSRIILTVKRSSKGKTERRVRGKENIPPAPSPPAARARK